MQRRSNAAGLSPRTASEAATHTDQVHEGLEPAAADLEAQVVRELVSPCLPGTGLTSRATSRPGEIMHVSSKTALGTIVLIVGTLILWSGPPRAEGHRPGVPGSDGFSALTPTVAPVPS